MTRSVWVGGMAGILMLATACSDSALYHPPEPEYPAIEVDPLLLEFGTLELGSSLAQEVMISNVGQAKLEVSALHLDADHGFTFDAESPPIVLDPYGVSLVTLEFAPINGADIAGVFHVISNDPDEPDTQVQLHGAGMGVAIQIDPSVWDFGEFGVGCEQAADIAVRSVGTSPLTIDGFDFHATPTGNEMGYSTADLMPGMVLDPGDEATVTIHFNPSDIEAYEGLLTVTSNDPGMPEAEGVQYGEGVGGDWYTDEFVQEGNNWTDILWVVDNSCSMEDEQNQLGDDFSNFYSIINNAGVDFRIATVTTDDGHFVGNTPVLDSSTPNGAQVFADNCSLGTDGNTTEQGLKYGWEALQMALGGTPPNGSFYRPQAGLRVIFVSDEPDGSGSWSSYVANYQGLKANPNHVILSAICGTDGVDATWCNGAGGSAMAGTGYVDATNATGGILGSICDSSWATTLTNMGWQSMSLADTLPLTHEPIPSTITVEVNGVLQQVGWAYDANVNAVILEPDFVPDDGDEITITYQLPGSCNG